MLLIMNFELKKYFSLYSVKKEINPGELLQNIQSHPGNLKLYNRNYPANSNYSPISLGFGPSRQVIFTWLTEC